MPTTQSVTQPRLPSPAPFRPQPVRLIPSLPSIARIGKLFCLAMAAVAEAVNPRDLQGRCANDQSLVRSCPLVPQPLQFAPQVYTTFQRDGWIESNVSRTPAENALSERLSVGGRDEEILRDAHRYVIEGDHHLPQDRAIRLRQAADLLGQVRENFLEHPTPAKRKREAVLSEFAAVCEEVAEEKSAVRDKIDWLLQGISPMYHDHMKSSPSVENYRIGGNLWRKVGDLLSSCQENDFHSHQFFRLHLDFRAQTSSQDAAAFCYQQAGNFFSAAARELELSEKPFIEGVPSEAATEAFEEAVECYEDAIDFLKKLPKETLSFEEQAKVQQDIANTALKAHRCSPNPEREERAVKEAIEAADQFKWLGKHEGKIDRTLRAAWMLKQAGDAASNWKQKYKLYLEAREIAQEATRDSRWVYRDQPAFYELSDPAYTPSVKGFDISRHRFTILALLNEAIEEAEKHISIERPSASWFSWLSGS